MPGKATVMSPDVMKVAFQAFTAPAQQSRSSGVWLSTWPRGDTNSR